MCQFAAVKKRVVIKYFSSQRFPGSRFSTNASGNRLAIFEFHQVLVLSSSYRNPPFLTLLANSPKFLTRCKKSMRFFWPKLLISLTIPLPASADNAITWLTLSSKNSFLCPRTFEVYLAHTSNCPPKVPGDQQAVGRIHIALIAWHTADSNGRNGWLKRTLWVKARCQLYYAMPTALQAPVSTTLIRWLHFVRHLVILHDIPCEIVHAPIVQRIFVQPSISLCSRLRLFPFTVFGDLVILLETSTKEDPLAKSTFRYLFLASMQFVA